MEARLAMSWYCGSLLAVVVVLFLSASLGTGAGAGADLKGSCAATPHPDVCVSALQKDSDAKAAATPRDLAEAAIRAASAAGSAAGDYARREMDAVKDNGMWQCLNECAEDIEEALSHLDDSDGEIDDGKMKDVKLFLDTAEQDVWDCDQSCRDADHSAPARAPRPGGDLRDAGRTATRRPRPLRRVPRTDPVTAVRR